MTKKVLVLGVTGMLGHKLFLELSKDKALEVYGTQRSYENFLGSKENIFFGIDGDDFDTIIRVVAKIKPDIVINCIGLIKQTPLASDPLSAITVNSQLPHRIALLCGASNVRMIQFSTDCVFDGKKGFYSEKDRACPADLYGKTKLLGEVIYPHTLTIRTSIVGHELKGYLSLVEWFIRQKYIKGFKKAIFSGLTTLEVSRVVKELIIPNKSLSGLYHIASEPISKYDLLTLIDRVYGCKIKIDADSEFSLDRSLDASAFCAQTSYTPPKWEEMIEDMFLEFSQNRLYHKGD